uniref:Transposase n=2 Tax=Hordeum vulgare subsp. vulgare TaxID=112509 RepID=A0A8I6X5T8_HORVV
MAGRPSESINWDGLGSEADEDASEMNYEYEWVVPDHDEDMELPPRHMAKTTLWRRLKEGLFRRHTNAIKSTLTDENKVGRVRFCLSMFDEHTIREEPTFKEMYNVIHIDEKWFYRSRGSQNYYLANDEEDPYRSTQSKNFIEKVMFLAAVARPRFDGNGTMTFDGKLGIWPFTYQEPAKRKNKNRDAGTMVTKVLPAVTQNVVREYMINFLIPAIRARWPAAEHGMPIYLQQDNAKTHIPLDDPEFVAAAQAEGWDIRLTCQPPNSPDLNILDLGFFAALQALFQKLTPGSIDDIVIKVEQAFDEYPAERSNMIFLTLQSCMVEVLKQLRGNRYKVPHMRKAVKERLGNLPITIQCAASIVQDAIESLPDV